MDDLILNFAEIVVGYSLAAAIKANDKTYKRFMYIITWEQRAKVMLSSLDDEKY